MSILLKQVKHFEEPSAHIQTKHAHDIILTPKVM